MPLNQQRRRLFAAPLLLGIGGLWLARAQPPQALRIAVEVRKFSFNPALITLQRGVPVTFVLSTSDFVHGFAVPDFKVRVDVIPGKLTEVAFTPDRAGKFHFLCDNFCGEGHDQMSGFLIVSERLSAAYARGLLSRRTNDRRASATRDAYS